MALVYDHRNQSIRIAHTGEQYREILKQHDYSLGLNYWIGSTESVGDRIAYRHEHAHLTSYNATGLAEFHAIFLDYKSFIMICALNEMVRQQKSIDFPLIRQNQVKSDFQKSVIDAIHQIREQEAFFFGYGTSKSINELFSPKRQSDFFKQLDEPLASAFHANPNFLRYNTLIRQMLFTTPPQIGSIPEATHPHLGGLGDQVVRISARSVLEAYAISIEVVAEYVKTVKLVGLHADREEKKRLPAKIDRVALEVAIDVLSDQKVSLDEYVYGQAPAELYWGISLLTYAAMQVPVVEDIGGIPIVMGSIKQVSIAHRFSHLLKTILSSAIVSPVDTYAEIMKGEEEERTLSILNWLNQAHNSIGDAWSIKFYQHIFGLLERDPAINQKVADSDHMSSWFARALFYRSPYAMISEAGLFLPLNPRYIIASDGEIISSTAIDDPAESFTRFCFDSSYHILEAMLLEEAWGPNWDKVSISDSDHRQMAVEYLLQYFVNQKIEFSFRE